MADPDLGGASPLEMAVIEANARALGVSVDSLMENAGRSVAERAAARLPPPPARVAIVAGIGNNGGDGSCAAFYLAQWGYATDLWLVRPPSDIQGASARRCWERARSKTPTHLGAPRPEDLQGAALVVDALLGIGARGEPRGPTREAIESINRAGVPVLSVDIPSGLGTPFVVRPTWTATFTERKQGMIPSTSGEVEVLDIGIPPEARDRTGPGDFLRYRLRRENPARGRTARVLVIGGGPFSGAPALAALAALRSGAERAVVCTPSPSAEAVRALSPDLIVRSVGTGAFVPADVPRLLDTLQRIAPGAVVLGMGAGRDPPTLEAFRELLGALRGKIPLVVDADALPSLEPTAEANPPVVATPNSGEYERVFGVDEALTLDERLRHVRERASTWGVTMLAKGAADLISDGRQTSINLHHHVGATVGGVGDLLAGTVGSLMAQGLPSYDAARLAAYWVGDAGGRVAEQLGSGTIATDVLAALPTSLMEGLRRVGGP